MADPIGSFSGLASGIQWRDMVDQIMQLEISRRITPLQERVTAAEKTRTAWNSYNSLLSKLSTASDALRDQSAFGIMKTSATLGANDKSLLTTTASAGAAPGNHSVEVIDLARAEKLSGGTVASTTAQLGLAGQFHVNGKTVTLVATDTLSSLREKINAMNSGSTPTGVTATILSTSSTQHRLVLTSDGTGSRGIELTDGSTGVLQSLGMVGSTLSQNSKPGDSTRTQTHRLTSHTTALAAMLGISAPPVVTTIVVDGRKIQVDLENDTLLSISYRINAAGGSSEITDEVVGGKTMKRLTVGGDVTADATGTDPAASQRIVELLGFQTRDKSAQITTGRDAKFRIDGFTMTRRTNTVSDAISGVSINLTASNSALRTSSATGPLSILTDPKTIDSGTYGVSLLTSFRPERTIETSSPDLDIAADPGVADGTYAAVLSEVLTRTTSATTGLDVLAAPGTVTAGTYAVNITTAASVASQTGSGFGASYSGQFIGSDTITISTGTGSAAVNVSNGQSLNTIINNLNTAFASNGVSVSATNVGGQLKLTSTMGPGSSSSFTVSSSHSRIRNNFGINDGTYTGTNVAGTIGGLAATGVGDVLTGSAGAVTGLEVEYSGSGLGAVGSVTVTDTPAITGGTIGGFAATWDDSTNTLTVNGGNALAGLSVTYSGSATSGSVGNVVVQTAQVEYISGATIDGEAAVWDEVTETITGAAGTRFEGLEIGYTGAVDSGLVGEFTVEGEIAVEVNISRDVDGTVNKVKELATAYNELMSFVDKNRAVGGAFYANGALRSMQDTVRRSLVGGVDGLSSANQYTHPAIAGVSLAKDGTLTVDAAILKRALETNHTDVKALFSTSGTPTDSRVSFIAGGDSALAGSYAINITTAAAQAAHAGSAWGGATYTATDGVDDDITLTNSATGKTTTITIAQGRTLAQVIDEINVRSQEEGLGVTASNVGGALKLATTSFGSATTLTVAGTAAAPLGLTNGTYAGGDVAGTIGGLAAAGVGTALTGTTGATKGITISYSDDTTGSLGTLSYVLGVGGTLERLIKPLTRAGDGAVVTQVTSLDSNITSLNRRMDDAETRLEIRRQAMIAQFTRMESALSLLQSQGARLQSQIGVLPTNSER